MTTIKQLRPRERDAIIQSLYAGVTPHKGIHYIQVGRKKELEAVQKDIERIIDGGSSIRFIIGEYGSGKSFFLQLMRSIALQMGLVTVHADLSPERRLYASNGEARLLYAELIHNMSTRTRDDGNALKNVVEKFISIARTEAKKQNLEVQEVIEERLAAICDLQAGYDFAQVIGLYWKGHQEGDERLQLDAIRWLRGEFATKTDARNALGIRTIVTDATIYDYLKIMSYFVRQAGYKGLLVCLDEMVNLYKLSSAKSRDKNYEKILNILNDTLQGGSSYIGFLMGGTPEFLMDPRKGLYSYEALRSRLSQNSYTEKLGCVDYNSPTLHLSNLTPEELFVLIRRLRDIFTNSDPDNCLISDQGLHDFLEHCSNTIGIAYFKTPRNTIKEFIHLLSALSQNPDVHYSDLITKVQVQPDVVSTMGTISSEEYEENNSFFLQDGF